MDIFLIIYFLTWVMAKVINSISARLGKPKVHRKGVHAKSKTSRLKGSKNYSKPYRGQGK